MQEIANLKALPIVVKSGNAFAADSIVALAELMIGTGLCTAGAGVFLGLPIGLI